MARKLSALAVNAIRGTGLHAVGDGLYLRITPTGTRSWVYRYMRDGQAHKMGLGSYPAVALAAAREKANDAKRLLARGQDPIAARADTTPSAMTFKAAAEAFIDLKRDGWRNGKSAAQWEQSLRRAYSKFGRLSVADLKPAHIVECLRPIWNRTPESAARLRGRIENILDYAIARGLRDSENPARLKILKHLLPAQRHTGGHFAAMPHAEVAEFMRALKGEQGIGAIGLRFAILTAARSGEVRGMTWDEIDIGERLWTIPADRMKGGRLHRVPLSTPAVDILKPLKELGRGPLVFEGMKRSQPMSDMTLTATIRRMGLSVTAHGFRSSFRDWCGDTGQDREVAEAALAHLSGNEVERAYARSDLFTRRRELMEKWAEYIAG
ncbi:MAG: tyrosine-type recombinase/integrase [Hyphomicrobiaceae bacterium]